MDNNAEAEKILAQFDTQIWWAVHKVRRSFDLGKCEMDDLYQDASILVLSYAGLLKKRINGHGNLVKWSQNTDGSETTIKKLLSRQLRISLSQQVGRRFKKVTNTTPLPSELREFHPTVYYQDVIPAFQGDELCTYCGKIMDPYVRHVDHNHTCCPTGFVCGDCVRGLTHPWCNTGAIASADRKYREGEVLSPRNAAYVLRTISDIHPYLGGAPERLYDRLDHLNLPTANSAEDEYISSQVGLGYTNSFREEFPFLAMQAIGEMTVAQIRKAAKVSRRTVMYRLSQERADLAPVWEYKGSSFGDWLKLLDRNELRLIRKIGLYEYLARKVGWHLNLDGSEELEDLITAIENLGLV